MASSDQGLPCLIFLTSILWIPALITITYLRTVFNNRTFRIYTVLIISRIQITSFSVFTKKASYIVTHQNIYFHHVSWICISWFSLEGNLLLKFSKLWGDFNFQIIKMLTEKCRNQEAMIEEFELREQEYQELMSETDVIKQENESMK